MRRHVLAVIVIVVIVILMTSTACQRQGISSVGNDHELANATADQKMEEQNGSGQSQSATSSEKRSDYGQLDIDLTKIGYVGSKGRLQDHRSEVVDQLIERGAKCIPYLIDRLEDETVVVGRGLSGDETEGPVIAFWYETTVGDIAFIILTNFFTDSTWENTTIQGVGWDEILGRRNKNITAEQVLREFIEKHGRQGLKAEWQKIWEENRDKIFWDESERCFKIKKN